MWRSSHLVLKVLKNATTGTMPQQVTRLLTLFAVLAVVLVTGRHFLVPPTFGKLGHYRAAAVDAIAAQEVKYAGRQACVVCHEQEAAVHSRGHHQTVACEVCHGPGAAHVNSPGEVKPPAPRRREFCPVCHGYDSSRPTGFPQIDPVAHNPLQPCINCHQPHAPEPPHVPEQCSACHAEIARTKALSHHALLACTRCHETDKKHLVTPRLSLPQKPRTREFCAECHAREAKSSKEIPRIDLATHNPRYVCWQCHYPHFPELQ